jgi:hypothetical protein
MRCGLFYEASEDGRYTHAEREGARLDLMASGETRDEVTLSMAQFADEMVPKV